MSISTMPPMTASEPAAAQGDDENFIGVVLETMVSGLPEMIKQDPEFKKALLDALGISSETEVEEEGEKEEGEEDDLDSLLAEDAGDEDGDLDTLLAGLEDIAEGDDLASL